MCQSRQDGAELGACVTVQASTIEMLKTTTNTSPIPKSTLLGMVQPTTCLSGFGQPLLVQPTPPV